MREREDFILLFVEIELNTLFTFSKIYVSFVPVLNVAYAIKGRC